MRCRVFIGSLAFLPLLLPSSSHAQIVSAYGLAGGTHVSRVQVSSSGASVGGWSPAFGGGLTFNFLNLPVAKLGIDARGLAGSGSNAVRMGEISLRAGFQPPVLQLKPYAQVGVGYATRDVATLSSIVGTVTDKFVTVGGHAGLDRPIAPAVDWRVVDVGIAYGHALNAGRSAANFFSVTTGLVVLF